jgi:putative hemolysin
MRYLVFGQKLGARLEAGTAGLDADELDAYCQHLLVREARVADVLMLLDVNNLNPTYSRHFLERVADA